MQFLEMIKDITYNKVSGNLEQNFIGKIKIDSRLIKTGDVFVALVGTKQDGHNFILDAISSGAKCIITEKSIVVPDSIIVVQVNDSKKTLLELAKFQRKRYLRIPLIAITGSVGKTTTKELLSILLSKKYRVLKSKGNYNNHIGVPLTLLELDDSYDICVLELGMNHQGEIDALSRICLPTDAVITNIGTSHIGNLGSKKNIFTAKMEIINSMQNGTLFINYDDSYLKKVKSDSLFVVKCGLRKNSDFTATDILCTENKMFFQLKLKGDYYSFVCPIPNSALISDILLAIAVAYKYQVPIADMVELLGIYQTLESRNQIMFLKNGIILIDDSYNASFESLQGGLRMIEQFDKEKIVIIGDILELGEFSHTIHKKISKLLGKYEKTIFVGNYVKNIEKKGCIYCQNVEDVMKYIETLDLTNKLIYLKGSHGIELDKLAKKIKQEFC